MRQRGCFAEAVLYGAMLHAANRAITLAVQSQLEITLRVAGRVRKLEKTT